MKDLEQQIERSNLRRRLMYLGLLSFIPTFNLFFGFFVWNKYDLAPNQAIGIISLVFMIWIMYNWIKDNKELKAQIKKQLGENK